MKVTLEAGQAAPAMRTMPPTAKKAMRTALEKLAQDPSGRSVGLDVRRLDLDGGLAIYRLRVGDWRAAFEVGPSRIRVIRLFHREDGYGWLAGMV